VVELKNVTKTYANGTMALKNVNLKINKGEFAFNEMPGLSAVTNALCSLPGGANLILSE
jgi:ABC-type ATPase involved in cell division